MIVCYHLHQVYVIGQYCNVDGGLAREKRFFPNTLVKIEFPLIGYLFAKV
jgi:hypothetical protein